MQEIRAAKLPPSAVATYSAGGTVGIALLRLSVRPGRSAPACGIVVCGELGDGVDAGPGVALQRPQGGMP